MYMHMHIFKTLLNRIEQSYEAENNFVVLQLSRRSILQGFTFKTHIFKGHQRSGPSKGRRSGSSCFKIPSWVIL